LKLKNFTERKSDEEKLKLKTKSSSP